MLLCVSVCMTVGLSMYASSETALLIDKLTKISRLNCCLMAIVFSFCTPLMLAFFF